MIRLSTGLSGAFARLMLLALTVAIIGGGAAFSYASKTDLVTVKSALAPVEDALVLTRGMADIVSVPGNVADVLVADPSVVDVMALQSNSLYVVGVNLGSTNLITVDDQGNVLKRFNVHVRVDSSAIQNTLNRLFPGENIDVAATNDQVILTGHVSSPGVAERVSSIVASALDAGAGDSIINMLTVAGEQQVMLKVKIVEASRNVLRELGVQTQLTGESIGNTDGSLLAGAATALSSDPLGIGTVLYNAGGSGFGPLQVVIRALEDQGLVNTLAEPNLTAISGQEAGFLAGGEFPIPTAMDSEGNVIVTFRPFGVGLNFRPVVISEDRISLQLETEVSSVSETNSLSQGGLNIPGFSVRRAQTTVELASGGSLMIAGLLQSDTSKAMAKLPGVANLPIIGDLLSSRSFQRAETELVIIVTPFLVRPYKDPVSHAAPIPVKAESHLSRAFAHNIKRTYAPFGLDPALFKPDSQFGYIID